MDLLSRILLYLRTTKTPPSRFGREVMGDPGLVRDMLAGRQPRGRTVIRLHAWLDLRGVAR